MSVRRKPAGAMASMLHERTKPAPEQRERFVAAGVEVLLREQPRDLFSDYDPDRHLAGIAAAAGVKESAIPWKSRTYLSQADGKVYAKCGYGKVAEPIWPIEQGS